MVDRPDRLDPVRRIGEEKTTGGPTPPGASFEEYMQKAAQQPGAPSQPTTNVTPFDLAKRPPALATEPTYDNLLKSVQYTQGMLGGVNAQLQTPKLKLKKADRTAVKTHLSTANSYLASANEKLDLEPAAPPSASTGGVFGQFFDLLTQGQANLSAAQQQLVSLKTKGESIKPADFLTIQLKISNAQREIEYGSLILGNVVQGMKTLFNVQL